MSKKAECVTFLGSLSDAIEEWAEREPLPGELDRLTPHIVERIREVFGDRIAEDCRIDVEDCQDSEIETMRKIYALGRVGDEWTDAWGVTFKDLMGPPTDPWDWLSYAVERVVLESERSLGLGASMNDPDGGKVETGGNYNHSVSTQDRADAVSHGYGALAVAAGDLSARARTYGDAANAVANAREVDATTYGGRAHAFAAGAYVDGGSVVASTYGGESCAVAVGGRGGRDYITWAETEGNFAHSVAVGARSEAISAGRKAHAVALGGRKPAKTTAVAAGVRAVAFAPEGEARSDRWIAVGAKVVLPAKDSVGVLLPTKGDARMPVVVTGRTHPVGVALTLDDAGQVVAVE